MKREQFHFFLKCSQQSGSNAILVFNQYENIRLAKLQAQAQSTWDPIFVDQAGDKQSNMQRSNISCQQSKNEILCAHGNDNLSARAKLAHLS